MGAGAGWPGVASAAMASTVARVMRPVKVARMNFFMKLPQKDQLETGRAVEGSPLPMHSLTQDWRKSLTGMSESGGMGFHAGEIRVV